MSKKATKQISDRLTDPLITKSVSRLAAIRDELRTAPATKVGALLEQFRVQQGLLQDELALFTALNRVGRSLRPSCSK